MDIKKWKVLIVEDEFRIGLMIKKLIKWDEIGLEFVGLAENGEIALNIIEKEKPDIVVTDIRMPKIGGLELISLAKQKNDNIRFVIITGYKEFEYAHKALRYGVNDYLLKPINEEELNKVLRKIQTELSQKHKEEENLIKTVSASKHIIKSRILNNIINTNDKDLLNEIKNDYNLMLSGDTYRSFVIKLDYWDYEKHEKKQDRLTVEKIVSVVDKNLKSCVKEQLTCEKDNLYIYCLINYDFSQSKETKNIINNILSEIHAYLLNFELYEATIGIGPEVTEFAEISSSIQDAYRAVQNRIKVGTGRLIYSQSLQLENQIEVEEFLRQYREKYLMSIEVYSKESFEQYVSRIFYRLHSMENIDFSCCYDIAKELIELFFDNIGLKNNEGTALKQFLFNAYQHCYTIGRLKDLLVKYLGGYIDLCLKQLKTETVKPIRIAKQYINEHYNEKIVLEDIANMVGLNPVYFSVLFKKETGLNFSDYLVNYRMDVAKNLLRSTNDTIVAIADSVGYKDARYFSQLFTKIVGIKPALYRKLHS
ncbi:MAG: response regulator [Clostridiaceae bacterium]|nr:response regulator [Clostridiaceae bacterium]